MMHRRSFLGVCAAALAACGKPAKIRLALNWKPDPQFGGFYAALQYGVFFPLGGLEYLPGQQGTLPGTSPKINDYSLSSPQTIRLILGVMF